nr:hypothetical protein [Micromonospora sp. DSM 115978]
MTWGTPRAWRSIGCYSARRTGPEDKVWIDTGSGPGLEVPRAEAHRFVVPPFLTGTLSGVNRDPDPKPFDIPDDVTEDALRMTLQRHMPTTAGVCACGAILGEETGLCRAARLALDHLMRILSPDEPDEPEGV